MGAEPVLEHASAVAVQDRVLNPDQLAHFDREGYLVLPGFLPDSLTARLRSEVDVWVDSGLRARSIEAVLTPNAVGTPNVLELDLPAHGELITHTPLLATLARLLGPRFVFHHLHSDRHAPDLPGKPWHHDYEQPVQSERRYPMVHALHYLDGIDSDMAGLAVLPRSHREIAAKDARKNRGTDVLPGEVYLRDLPPGTTVVLHSALFHARRAEASGTGRARYFVDASYCQSGTRWPTVKPYWREMLQRARAKGLDAVWPGLFDEDQFSDYVGPA